jgi:hypothetical protein
MTTVLANLIDSSRQDGFRHGYREAIKDAAQAVREACQPCEGRGEECESCPSLPGWIYRAVLALKGEA